GARAPERTAACRARRRRRRCASAWPIASCRPPWQNDANNTTGRLALTDGNPSPVSLDDSFADGQSEPRPAHLRRVERVERLLPSLGPEPRAVVTHGNFHAGLSVQLHVRTVNHDRDRALPGAEGVLQE